MPAASIASDDDNDETARVRRDRVPVVAPPARRPVALYAGVALLGVVGVGLGAVLAVGTSDAPASDEVTVTVASTAGARADDDEPASAPPPSREPPSTTEPEEPEKPEKQAAATPPPEPAPERRAQPAVAAPAKGPADEERARAPKRKAAATTKAPAADEREQTRARQQRSQRPRPKGKVILEMASGWAHAYLGKRKLCETPCTVELPAGTHLLRFVGGDGKERKHRVTVKADATVRSVVPTKAE
jgi:hypothetical protein